MMKSKSLAILLIGCLVATGFALAVSESASDAAGPFVIEDANKKQVRFNGPADKVILLGYGYVLTVCDLGCSDKIAGTDKYGSDYIKTNKKYKDLNIESVGNFYSESAQIVTKVTEMIRDGKFNKEKDWIVAPNYNAITGPTGLISQLDKSGIGAYNLIVLSATAETYDGVVKVVKDLGKIVNADSEKLVKSMELVKTTITGKVAGENLKDRHYVHIGSWTKVYNESFVTSLFNDTLKGINVGKNTATTKSYATDKAAVVRMVTDHADTVVIVDNMCPEATVTEIKSVLTGHRVLVLDREHNNVCPQASDGLWALACTAYPANFQGATPEYTPPEDNTLVYLAAGIIVSIAVCAAVILLRNKH